MQYYRENTAFLRGGDGCDYATTGANTAGTGIKWYGFAVNEDTIVDKATFVDEDGTAVSITPTWLDKSLTAGQYLPFGFTSGGKAIYATAVTVTSGSVILYRSV